ncbi:MAG TPA: phage holin family protein [Marmoricola sp.]|nr:phage holin family protein [Marmoricola sp.]
MSTPYNSPPQGGQPGTGPTGRYESVSDAIPDPEPIHGAQETYAKGEVGSIGELISDISADLSTLMRQEVALAKAEAKDSATKAGKGAGMLAGAGYAAHLMVLFLSITLWMVLAYLFDDLAWSAVVVAVLWGIVAAVLAMVGRKQLKKVQGMPQTTETAKRVPDALKGNEDPR